MMLNMFIKIYTYHIHHDQTLILLIAYAIMLGPLLLINFSIDCLLLAKRDNSLFSLAEDRHLLRTTLYRNMQN
jgi:hypothetical protein